MTSNLGKLWLQFRGLPSLVRRGIIAAILYLLWLFSAWIYSEGLHGAAVLLGAASSFGFFFAIGGRHILRFALFILVWWLRLF